MEDRAEEPDAIIRQVQATYDQIAAEFAAVNAAMPVERAAYAEHLLELTGPAPRILELGCGAGRDMAWLEARGALVIGADLSTGMLAQARKQVRGPLLQMDMRYLGFQDGAFQGVWCASSLLHLPKRQAPLALAEIHRVLAPGGLLFLGMHEGEGETWEKCPYADAVRFFARYTPEEIAALLAGAGFTILEQAISSGSRHQWLRFLARLADD